MSYKQAKQNLAGVIHKIFNMETAFLDKLEEAQNCVLYIKIENFRAYETNIDNYLDYFISGKVMLLLGTTCNYEVGLLTDRAKNFGNIKGINFALNEIVDGEVTSLEFQYFNKDVEIQQKSFNTTVTNIENVTIKEE